MLRVDHPQSVRHAFYRMTDPRLPEPVEKSDLGYGQVQDRIVKLRRADKLPYTWISDASRRGYFVDTFDGAADFLRRMNGLYRSDLWVASRYHCEVWVESRSLAGVVQDDCEELAVSLYPSGGFTSISLAYQAADYLRQVRKPIIIFYIGDFDPAGVLIDVSVERELRTHLPNDVDLTFRRLGITEEQIRHYDLPIKPRKEGDRRAPHINGTVEAEAMPAGELRRIIRDAIEELLPADALKVAKAAELAERSFIHRLANLVENSPPAVTP